MFPYPRFAGVCIADASLTVSRQINSSGNDLNFAAWKCVSAALVVTFFAGSVYADPVAFTFTLTPDDPTQGGGTGSVSFSDQPIDGYTYTWAPGAKPPAYDEFGNTIASTLTDYSVRFDAPRLGYFAGTYLSYPASYNNAAFTIDDGAVSFMTMNSVSYFEDYVLGTGRETLSVNGGTYSWSYVGFGTDRSPPVQYSSTGKITFDQVATPVPEPSTYLLMALGLGAVGLLKRRRTADLAAA